MPLPPLGASDRPLPSCAPLTSIGPRGYLHDPATGRIVGFGDAQFQVRAIARETAAAMIKAHHYSRRVVANSYVHLGVFHRGVLSGALQYGYAMNPASGRNVVAGTGNRDYLELNRMWLSDAVPRNGESMAIAFSVKYIKKILPAVAWIQSFADERCGRWGVVYQACNFLYCGFHRSTFYELDGVWYHKILATCRSRQGVRSAYLQANLDRARPHVFRQFRYVLFLRPAARRRLCLSVLPYPKPEGAGC
ncbi:Mom family adenine methylcarbamoylation protein [Azospirillum sp. A39]|uniref:Mom family adenine methylcarbamoylation protein n=1 Tax=Azospirillum sp. A39 TaxID=3462279 RepID=UPI00404687FD